MVYLEYRDTKSIKFWQIELCGLNVKLLWGKLGTKGQSKEFNFSSDDEALQEFKNKIQKKIESGYQSALKPEEGLDYDALQKKYCALLAKVDPTLEKSKNAEAVQTAVAANSFSRSIDLDALSWSTSAIVRRLVAVNPHTPPETLLRLSLGEYPINDDALSNEKYPIASVDKILHLQSARWTLSSWERAPVSILKILAKDEDSSVRARVASNPTSSLDILNRLSEDENEWVRAGVAKNSSCSGELILRMSRSDNEHVLDSLAKNPKVDGDILKKLSSSGRDTLNSYWVPGQTSLFSNRRAADIAKNPNASLELLLALKDSDDVRVRMNVALNENCSDGILSSLANDEADNVRASVAKSLLAPADLIALLSTDSSETVRREVAHNPSIPEIILRKLSSDKNTSVRSAIASRSDTPEDVLSVLAFDKNKAVKEQAIDNENLPKDIMRDLLENQKLTDSRKADLLIRLGDLDGDRVAVISQLNKGGRLCAAWHKMANKKLLASLSHDKDAEVVFNVLRNPHCTDEIRHSISERYNYL